MDGLPIALAALGHRCMVISPRSSPHLISLVHGAGMNFVADWYDFFRLRSVLGGMGHKLLGVRPYGWKAGPSSQALALLLAFIIAAW